MPQKLIIEIGTNTIKALCAELINSDWQIISEDLYPSRIGAGLAATGNINPDAMEKSLLVIKQIIEPLTKDQECSIEIIATESLRSAHNADVFMDEVRKRFGLFVKIISGKEEARYAYLAATFQRILSNDVTAVLDIGGGSTELTLGQNKDILNTQSIAIGAVKLTELFIKHDPPLPSELADLTLHIEKQLQEITAGQSISKLIGVGGTITTLALLALSEQQKEHLPINEMISRIDGSVLSQSQIKIFIEMLSKLTNQERQNLPGMPKGRADIILAGTLILDIIMTHLKIDKITVSIKGVRYGFLYEHSS